jgi:hypothetical protein
MTRMMLSLCGNASNFWTNWNLTGEVNRNGVRSLTKNRLNHQVDETVEFVVKLLDGIRVTPLFKYVQGGKTEKGDKSN